MRIRSFLLALQLFSLVSVLAVAQITLKGTDGRRQDFHIKGQNRFQVIIFLLSDCPACQSYTKTLNRLHHTYEKKGITFTGVFPGNFQTPEEIELFRSTYRIGFPLLIDRDKQLTHFLHATVSPQVFVLDPSGTTVYSGRIDDWMYAVGKKRVVITKNDLQSALEAVTNGLHPDPAKTEPIGCIID